MRFSKTAVTVLITTSIVMITSLSYVSIMISRTMTSSFHDTNFELMQKAVESSLQATERNALASAETIVGSPAVRDAFGQRDRTTLHTLTRDMFATLHDKYGVAQGHFHLAPATSFLRMHKPEKFGDDLSAIRTLVVDVNKTSTIRSGTEITSSGIAIFGVIPVKDVAGNQIGSVEIGYEIGGILDHLKRAYGFESALLIDEVLLKSKATSLTGDVFNDDNRVGKYVKFFSTNSQLTKRLIPDSRINIRNREHYLDEVADSSYGVLLLPFYDYSKTQIGVIAVASDLNEIESQDKQAIVWQVSLAVIAIIMMCGVVLVVIRGFILKPLDHLNLHVKSLVDQGAPSDLDTDHWVEEMKQLSDNITELGKRIGKPGRGAA